MRKARVGLKLLHERFKAKEHTVKKTLEQYKRALKEQGITQPTQRLQELESTIRYDKQRIVEKLVPGFKKLFLLCPCNSTLRLKS